MIAVRQFRLGWAEEPSAGTKEIPSMVSVTLETRAANRSALGMGFIVVPLHLHRLRPSKPAA
jgi:hypothetical protein